MDDSKVACGRLVFALAFVAGFADAGSFILMGVFSGHLTGNSILSLIQLIRGEFFMLSLSLTAIGGFCAGTAAGILQSERHRASGRPLYGMMLTQSALIAGIILCRKVCHGSVSGDYGFTAGLSFALGLQNGLFRQFFASRIHTTYITGTTTTFMESLLSPARTGADAAFDRRLHAIIPAAFVLGGGAGAWLSYRFGVNGFAAIIPLLLLAVLCYRAVCVTVRGGGES